MINKVLTAAGLKYRRSRFLKPPAETYAVYLDDVTTDGPDGINAIFTHDYIVEIYAPTQDDEACEALEAALNAEGLRWTVQDWYWLQDVQRYQKIYEFTYIEKRRI
jgi:hypothetical protein